MTGNKVRDFAVSLAVETAANYTATIVEQQLHLVLR
jgi:hypothetical protein